jgi:hypothetical protein
MKLSTSVLTFTYLVRSEFETQVRVFFTQKRKKKILGPEFETRVRIFFYTET